MHASSAVPLPKKAHWSPLYIYAQSAVIALIIWFLTYERYQDDAYISLVYARNLISGHGLAWNPGEYVEGYSNFLFLIVVAGLGWLGIDLVLASKMVSFLGYFGLVATLAAFIHCFQRRRFSHSPHAYAHSINAALCIALTASSAIVLGWCFGGLETVFFTFLLTLPVCMILYWLEFGCSNRLVFITGILFALAAMTRLEGLMIWGVTGLFLGLLWLLRLHKGLTFAKLTLLGAGFLLIFAPYMGWRIWYFGEWLPNTYYAKTFAIHRDIIWQAGLGYFFLFIIMPPNLALFVAGLLIMARRRQSFSYPVLYLMVISAAYCLHVIHSGGDHMPYLRFFVPVVPLFALLIYFSNATIIPTSEKKFRDICGALIVLSLVQFITVQTDEVISRGALSGAGVAEYIPDNWPEGSLIAINPAGALPYYAPHYRYIDMLGLMDKHIARRPVLSEESRRLILRRPIGHLKGDGAYVLSRKPDYIIFGDAWGDEKPRFLSDLEIAQHPDFSRDYERVETYVDVPERWRKNMAYAADINRMNAEKYAGDPYFVNGPVLNNNGQLRFIYYKRKH